jgi:hypothetical protein
MVAAPCSRQPIWTVSACDRRSPFAYTGSVVKSVFEDSSVAMKRASISVTLLALSSALVCGSATGTPPDTQRFPFDPACAWGRISNGRGLILRCLTREESERLSRATATTPGISATGGAAAGGAAAGGAAASGAASTPAAPTKSPSSQPPPSTNDGVSVPAAAVGSSDGAHPSATPSGSAATATSTVTSPDAYEAELVSVVADEGELPLARRKLAAPLDRYVKCVANHGGLTAPVGLVEVRFLVRERGRAEGTSVEKSHGVTEAAANCIAQVIDRRPTGVPEAPLVGATATIRVRKRTVSAPR